MSLARLRPEPAMATEPGSGVLRRARLRAALRLAWLGSLEAGDARAPAEAGLARLLADADAPAAEAAFVAADPALAPTRAALAAIEAAPGCGEARLAHAIERLGLQPFEADLLGLLWAASLDPALTRLLACCDPAGGAPGVTQALAARLFGHPRSIGVMPLAALEAWRLVQHGQADDLALDPGLAAWLAGLGPPLPGPLAARARILAAPDPLPGWPVAETAARAEAACAPGAMAPLLIAVEGPPGAGRRSFAAAAMARLGLRVVAFDAAGLAEEARAEAMRRLVRAALLQDAVPAWCGAPPPADPGLPRPVIGVVILGTGEAVDAPGATVLRVALPLPGPAAREALWHRLLPEAAAWSSADRQDLALARAAPGDIAAVAAAGAAGPAEARSRLRDRQAALLPAGVRRLATPHGWDDLVLPDRLKQALADFADEAGWRARLLEGPALDHALPLGRGLVGLLSGPPGTGKTLAVQVLANRLKADLFRIDLAQVVSKYVGETAQRLDRVLEGARHAEAVLFFDEADALFGRRGEQRDAQDRYASTETAWLLQAIEEHPGTVLLATNRRSNIDPAFLRRFRLILEFPRPDAAARLAIWHRLWRAWFPAQAAPAAAFAQAAEAFDMTGAQIRGALLTALVAARAEEAPVAPRHLMRGVDRELLKEGRALSARDWRRLGGDG